MDIMTKRSDMALARKIEQRAAGTLGARYKDIVEQCYNPTKPLPEIYEDAKDVYYRLLVEIDALQELSPSSYLIPDLRKAAGFMEAHYKLRERDVAENFVFGDYQATKSLRKVLNQAWGKKHQNAAR